jgi:hypothetical protein
MFAEQPAGSRGFSVSGRPANKRQSYAICQRYASPKSVTAFSDGQARYVFIREAFRTNNAKTDQGLELGSSSRNPPEEENKHGDRAFWLGNKQQNEAQGSCVEADGTSGGR